MSDTLLNGVVLSGTGGVWQVRTERGETVDAALRGRLKKSNSGKRADGSLRRDTISAAADTLKLAVGDDVAHENEPRPFIRLDAVGGDDAGNTAHETRWPPRNARGRRAPGR